MNIETSAAVRSLKAGHRQWHSICAELSREAKSIGQDGLHMRRQERYGLVNLIVFRDKVNNRYVEAPVGMGERVALRTLREIIGSDLQYLIADTKRDLVAAIQAMASRDHLSPGEWERNYELLYNYYIKACI